VTLGNNVITALRCNVQSISSLSDERDKTDWDYESIPGREFINELSPGYFTWNRRDKSMQGVRAVGFSAQQLLATQTKFKADPLNLVLTSNPDKLEAAYSNLIVPLVKAVKELSDKNDDLQKQLDEIKQLLINLK
jgi:hypothetical protein